MAELTVTPRGYAATAAEFLDASAEDVVRACDLPERQLAAMQAIGYGLLAVVDQLADLTDAVTDLGGQVGNITDAADLVAEILDPPEVLDPAGPAGVIAAFSRAFRGRRGSGGAR